MTPETIGILGGTFNPVHIGHLRLATAVAEALKLKHVDLMPCAVPPHKPDSGLLPFEMRVSLLQGALETPPNASPSDARLQVSTLEGELPHPSYTWNLITEWRKRHASESPMFILGGEDFMHLDTWHRGLELPNITNFVVVPRCRADEEAFRATIARYWPKAVITEPDENNLLSAAITDETSCLYLPLPHLDISASLLRTKWLLGESIRYLTPTRSSTFWIPIRKTSASAGNDKKPSPSQGRLFVCPAMPRWLSFTFGLSWHTIVLYQQYTEIIYFF